MRTCATLASAAFLLVTAGCDSPDGGGFSVENARRHVVMLAHDIGARPAGSDADDRARAYLVNELRSLGLDVRVQVTNARRPEAGLTAHVQNVVAIHPGQQQDAIALVAHYDSVPYGPGAGDDAFGAAVCVEAARALLADRPPVHTLAVILTDAEELGLMGAAALAEDPIAARIQVYLNFEAIGSGRPVVLFETGPGNAWAVRAWADAAPQPRGTSLGYELYRRMPNDTDFTILKRLGAPGLNFAVTGDGYAYHTARDTAERLTDSTLRQAGTAAVQTVRALDRRNVSTRTFDQATYFDILQRRAFSYGPVANAAIAWLSLALGILAWIRCARVTVAAIGPGRLLFTVVWCVVGAAFVLASMIAVTWALREAREFYHPWYAHPSRLFALIALVGALTGWSMARAGAMLQVRYRTARHPAVTWTIALPFWMVLAGVTAVFAPAASYLWTIPLMTTSVLLTLAPLRAPWIVRAVSLVALAVSLLFWAPLAQQLLPFMVTNFGRIPIITPVWAYAAVVFVCGMMIAPPLIAALTAPDRKSPAFGGWVTATLLVSIVIAAGMAYAAPAYTHDQPRPRHIRYVQDTSRREALWEVAGIEPGVDLLQNSMRWDRVHDAPPVSVPLSSLPHPFVFRAFAAPSSPLPARITISRGVVTADTTEFTVSVTPDARALAATFVLPADVVPIRPTLAGTIRRGRWVARFAAMPLEGITLHGFVRTRDAARLNEMRVLVSSSRMPGGTGPQVLPAWLPQEDTVWTSEATFIMSPIPEVAPVR